MIYMQLTNTAKIRNYPQSFTKPPHFAFGFGCGAVSVMEEGAVLSSRVRLPPIFLTTGSR
jgi:hypothetical protein